MKLFAVATLMTLAIASAHAGDSATCDLSKLTDLLSDPDYAGCTTKSGLQFPPPSTPTKDVLAKACGVPECVRLIGKVKAKNLGDCTLGAIKLESQLLTPVAQVCAGTAAQTSTPSPASTSTTQSNAPSSTSTVQSPVTTAPNTTTPAPNTTAPKPSTTTTTLTPGGDVTSPSASGSEGSSTDEDSYESTSTVPSPSQTGSASTVATAAAAALLAALAMIGM